MIRIPITALFAVAAALLGETHVTNAQSAYSYPWCAIYGGGDFGGGGGAMSCYFASWEQCRTTMSGIGGVCVASPYYHAQARPLPHRALVVRRRHGS
jgi:hypothetical protein